MTAISIITVLSGLLMFVLSLPLISRQIPMNDGYGIRIRAAFESEQRWYDINAYGGRQFARWSWVITLAGLAGFFVPAEHRELYLFTTLAVTAFSVLIPVVQIYRWSHK